MIKSKKLTKSQQQEIKRLYLQYSDEELSEIIGSNVKSIKSYREDNGLNRNQYTEDKLKPSVNEISVTPTDEAKSGD
ncbi:hypothetical protein [Aquimarina sp. 2201CG14-23]|uniref:hypothetical protein n=1 Tax=Aquimarina mycalae TaxID=3040073 RepID=UPI002477CC14|nr:hypothetical protein [Aquimarina sp. 2201CG14-23]MDH7444658.1 hypothetical protein [Aquimarina sp. 2201CG14-23]